MLGHLYLYLIKEVWYIVISFDSCIRQTVSVFKYIYSNKDEKYGIFAFLSDTDSEVNSSFLHECW